MNKERRMNKETRIGLAANKKGQTTIPNILINNVVYFIFLALFAMGMVVFLGNLKNSTSTWTEGYEKEIARVVDLAKPGDVIQLNVHKATIVASKNGVSDFNQIFRFDNVNKNICVNLKPSSNSCYPFFNDVIIVDDELIEAAPGNILKFKVAKSSGGTV